MATYGRGNPPFNEEDDLAPIDPYGIAKMAAETMNTGTEERGTNSGPAGTGSGSGDPQSSTNNTKSTIIYFIIYKFFLVDILIGFTTILYYVR